MAEAAILRRKRSGRGESLLNKLLISLVIFLTLFLLGEIVVQVFVVPNMVIKHIYLTTDVQISRETVLEMAGLKSNLHYFNLNVGEIERKIAEYPLVKSVSVKKIFPDSIRITIKGRKPLAVACVDVDGRTVPVTMDEEGVIYKIGASAKVLDMPVISGIVFKDLRLGMKMPNRVMPVLEDLYNLKVNDPDLFRLISEIKIIPINSIDYELVLFPLSYNIKVRLGKHLDSKTLKYAIMVLDLLKKNVGEKKIEEVDFRSGTMVYKLRRE